MRTTEEHIETITDILLVGLVFAVPILTGYELAKANSKSKENDCRQKIELRQQYLGTEKKPY